MPSSSLLYELGRATHRDDDYRIIMSAVWQTVLRSNSHPRVVLKTLMVLEAVLLHGPDRALEETIDTKVAQAPTAHAPTASGSPSPHPFSLPTPSLCPPLLSPHPFSLPPLRDPGDECAFWNYRRSVQL